MRYRMIFIPLMALLLALSACNLGRPDNQETPLTQTPSAPTGRPTVTIISPQNGDEVVVNEPVIISVSATDTVGITQVRLFVNNQTVRTVGSEAPTGDTNRNYLLDYTPRSTGAITVRVEAYRGTTSSEPAEINLTVRSTQAQVTATAQQGSNIPQIDPNDPTCRALVNSGLNFRRGPGTNYDIIRVLGAGELLPVIGRLSDNSWWQLASGTTLGWVSAGFVNLYGANCANIAVAVPPPSPTPRNQPTATPTVQPTATPTSQPTATGTPQPPNLDVPLISGPTTLTIPGGESSVSGTYGVTIRNRGGAINTQFSNTIRVTPGGAEQDLGVVASLGQNQSINLNITLTFPGPGTYTVRVIADSGNQITEDIETDNIGTIEVTVSN